MAREIHIRGSNYYRYLEPSPRRRRPPGMVTLLIVGLIVLWIARAGGKS